MKKYKKDSEQYWWMLLSETERILAKGGEDVLFAHQANAEARLTLVKEFGADLDHLNPMALDGAYELIAKHKKKDADDKVQMDEALKIIRARKK